MLEVSDRRVAVTGGTCQGVRRMTITYPELTRARRLLWIVTGESKREPLAKLLALALDPGRARRARRRVPGPRRSRRGPGRLLNFRLTQN